MPDFQFSEDNAASTPASPAPSAPPPDSPPDPPKEPAKFEFLATDSVPVVATPVISVPAPPAPIPTRPAPIVIPNPPIPSGVIPNPPLPSAVTPPAATPSSPAPNAAPTVVPNAARVAESLNPIAPLNEAPAKVSAPLKPRPSAVSIPTPTIPLPQTALPVAELPDARTGAPQDNYSLKIWSFGQSVKGVLDQMDGLASWILRVALVAGITALAYILAATVFGKAGHLEGNPNAVSLIQNLRLASQVLGLSLVSGSIASLLLGYQDNRLGAIVGGFGLAVYVGAPLALKNFVGISAATAGMVPLLRQTGYALVLIGLVKALCDSAVWLWGLPDKVKSRHANVGVSNQAEAKQRIIAREANMTSPCWKLPFCRESIRKQCPAFLAKKTCWKFGRGCYCDEEMISRIVRGEALDVIKAPTRQSRQGKAPCERCYIYLEHQTYKFRMLSPLALPITILTSWLLWPIYSRLFAVVNKAFDSIWNTLSFNTASLTPDAIKTSQESLDAVAKLGNDTAEFAYYAQNMFGVLLGFLLLVYLSKAIEWAIFKAKW